MIKLKNNCRILKISSLLLFLLLSSTVHAEIHFTVKNDIVTKKSRKNSKRLKSFFTKKMRKLTLDERSYAIDQIKSAIRLLPKKFEKISQKSKIKFSFWKFPEGKDNKNLNAKYYSFTNEIRINYLLLLDKQSPKKFIQVIIHELAHVYDSITRISKDIKFKHIFGWSKSNILILSWYKRRNVLKDRSVDHYEMDSTKESFAVNFEYFIMDSEYKCRYPLQYEFLARRLDYQPYVNIQCKGTSQVPLTLNSSDSNDYVKIDSSRIYEVHYLYADSGDGLESRWGHAMLRLVICSPLRNEVSKECLKDISHHLVLSYRADVEDMALNSLKGLFGGYNSNLFILPFTEILEEYTEHEFRDLISIPLKFNKDRIERIVNLILQEVWSFEGKYYFLTANCAVETLNFLKILFDLERIYKVDVLTPNGLLKKLKRLKLVKKKILRMKDKELVKEGYLFRNAKKKLEGAYNAVKPFLVKNSYRDFEHYIEKLNKSDIKYFNEKIVEFPQSRLSKDENLNILASSKYLLMYMKYYVKEAKRKKVKAILKQYKSSSILIKYNENLRAENLKLTSKKNKDVKYGIPSDKEFTIINQFRKSLTTNKSLREKVQKLINDNSKQEIELENYIKTIESSINNILLEMVLVGN